MQKTKGNADNDNDEATFRRVLVEKSTETKHRQRQ